MDILARAIFERNRHHDAGSYQNPVFSQGGEFPFICTGGGGNDSSGKEWETSQGHLSRYIAIIISSSQKYMKYQYSQGYP